jgi:hypothetical protein
MKDKPKKMRVTFPHGGINALHGLAALLKSDGRLRIFDYGYLNSEMLVHFATRSPEQDSGRSEIFSTGYSFVGGTTDIDGSKQTTYIGSNDMQITTPVNFPFLATLSNKLGLKIQLETWLSWASRVIGEPMTSPSHYAQGIVYLYGDDERIVMGYPQTLLTLVGTHKMFNGSRISTEHEIVDLLKKFQSVHKRIMRKARCIDISVDIVPEKSQDEFRRSFAPEINELLEFGCDREKLYWILFATPVDFIVSGSSGFICFTATKP